MSAASNATQSSYNSSLFFVFFYLLNMEAPCGLWGSLPPSWTFRECVECDKWNAFIAPLQVPQVLLLLQQHQTLKWTTQKSPFLPLAHGLVKSSNLGSVNFFWGGQPIPYGISNQFKTFITKPMRNNMCSSHYKWGIFRIKIRDAWRGGGWKGKQIFLGQEDSWD